MLFQTSRSVRRLLFVPWLLSNVDHGTLHISLILKLPRSGPAPSTSGRHSGFKCWNQILTRPPVWLRCHTATVVNRVRPLWYHAKIELEAGQLLIAVAIFVFNVDRDLHPVVDEMYAFGDVVADGNCSPVNGSRPPDVASSAVTASLSWSDQSNAGNLQLASQRDLSFCVVVRRGQRFRLVRAEMI